MALENNPRVRTLTIDGSGAKITGVRTSATVTLFAGPPLRIAVLHVPEGQSVRHAYMDTNDLIDGSDIELLTSDSGVGPGIYGLTAVGSDAALDVFRRIVGVTYAENNDSRMATGLAEITLTAEAIAAFGQSSDKAASSAST